MQLHQVHIKGGGYKNFASLKKAIRYSITNYHDKWEIKTIKAGMLVLCLMGSAQASELTYSSDPQWESREQVWLYQQIKRHEIRHTLDIHGDTLAIDGSAPAIQISSDSEYRDLVTAITKGGR